MPDPLPTPPLPEDARTFCGRTFAEAATQMVKELGKDAFVIERRTKRVPKKGSLLSGKLGGEDELVELIAAPAPPPAPSAPRPKTTLLEKSYGRKALEPGSPPPEFADAPPPPAAPPPTIARAAEAGLASRFDQLGRQIRDELRGEMQRFMALQARGGLPGVGPDLLDAYRRLIENDVAADIARGLVERVQTERPDASPEEIRDSLCAAVARTIATSGPISLADGRPTVVALVGPAGVGKTTTLAKIAVDFVFHKKKRVAVLNEDIHRPGAEAQIRSWSHLLSIPVSSIESSDRIPAELARYTDRDLILIDTGGRSPRNADAIRRLADLLAVAGADEVHLALSSDASERCAFDAMEAFRPTGWSRLILTKLDETATHGLLLSIAGRVAARFSYVTDGAEYTENLLPAEASGLARLALGLVPLEALHPRGGTEGPDA